MDRSFQSWIIGAAATLMIASASAAGEAPAVYPTPQDALDALVRGLEARNREDVIAVFGSDALDVISTGEAPRDRLIWGQFYDKYREGYRFVPQGDGTLTLVVGADDWPMPVPLVRTDGGWVFDAAAGRDEILARRIGGNELDVIELMHGYVGLQSEFRQVDYDGDGVMEFASRIVSTPGKKDGLYWPGDDSPLGDFFARAAADGYEFGGEERAPDPFHGYLYKMLNAQGPNAPGGQMDYMVGGHQLAGHALIAYPADYGDTGIMTFMVAENGIVLEADLGEDTAKIVAATDTYDPDARWTSAEE